MCGFFEDDLIMYFIDVGRQYEYNSLAGGMYEVVEIASSSGWSH